MKVSLPMINEQNNSKLPGRPRRQKPSTRLEGVSELIKRRRGQKLFGRPLPPLVAHIHLLASLTASVSSGNPLTPSSLASSFFLLGHFLCPLTRTPEETTRLEGVRGLSERPRSQNLTKRLECVSGQIKLHDSAGYK
jgi:hypothetical protein